MALMLACQEVIFDGSAPKVSRADRRRQSVTRRIAGYDQTSPSVAHRQRLWAIVKEHFRKRVKAKAVQELFFFRQKISDDHGVANQAVEVNPLPIFIVEKGI